MGKIGRRPNSRQDNQTPFPRRAGLYLGVAFELPGTVLGGILVGYFADNYFDTSPWLLIVCTAAAFVGAFVRLVRWVKFFSAQRDGSVSEKNHHTN